MATRVKRSKRLVIDASVARAAGGEFSSNPRAKFCRDFLSAVLTICHRIVMTPEISEEWKRHRSRFTTEWQVSMTARKKILPVQGRMAVELRRKLELTMAREKKLAREAVRKDLLLIEAAMATDRLVISLDETVRRLFKNAAQSVGELKNIVWVNPEKTEEKGIAWLENGAKAEKVRFLGFESVVGS